MHDVRGIAGDPGGTTQTLIGRAESTITWQQGHVADGEPVVVMWQKFFACRMCYFH